MNIQWREMKTKLCKCEWKQRAERENREQERVGVGASEEEWRQVLLIPLTPDLLSVLELPSLHLSHSRLHRSGKKGRRRKISLVWPPDTAVERKPAGLVVL